MAKKPMSTVPSQIPPGPVPVPPMVDVYQLVTSLRSLESQVSMLRWIGTFLIPALIAFGAYLIITMHGLRTDLTATQGDVKVISQRMDGVEKRLDKIDATLEKISDRLGKIDERLAKIEAKAE